MKMTMEAPAKINLFLQVGPAGGDGYHPVRTVMQAVEVCDLLEMELAPGEGWIDVEPARLADQLGDPAGNLAWRAWEAFAEITGFTGSGLRIKLHKHIPLAAGLGGGSADAAAVLLGLELMSGRPLGHEKLSRLAADLGSDVPFFLTGGTALAEGRGEKVAPLAPAPLFHVFLANPGVPVATSSVYRRFDETGAEAFERRELEAFLETLGSGEELAILRSLRNDLESPCLGLSQEALRLKQRIELAMNWAGMTGLHGEPRISGSGPTCFVLCAEERDAAALERMLGKESPYAAGTRFRQDGCRPLA